MVNSQLIHHLSRVKGGQAIIRPHTIRAATCRQRLGHHHAAGWTANALCVSPQKNRRPPSRICCSRLNSTLTRSAISSSSANIPTKKHDSSATVGHSPKLSIKSRNPATGGSSKVTKNKVDVTKLTQNILSGPINFETSLQNARNNDALLKSLGLTSSEAQSILILPPDILRDVHLAISHFSKSENFPGISLNHCKIPGPILCARLLELIGIPRYYSDLVATSGSSSIVDVHSSQIDDLLHCCLQTTLALSNSCKVGRGSLIGIDFNSNAVSDEKKKTAAHLAEEIWKTVRNMHIKFTFQQKSQQSEHNGPVMTMPNLFMSRLGAMNKNVIHEYLSSNNSHTQHPSGSWSRKDQRRYKQAKSLFNATLSAYARLGSSASGIRQEVRREMVQAAERLLLELAAKNNTADPSPSSIFQCTRPDVISFNTAMNAWVQLSPRVKSGDFDNEDASMATLTAERTHAILQMMQEMWDEERSNHSTTHTIEADWIEYGDGEEMHKSHAVPPNTSSYNTVLNAWSRSSSSNAMDNAMEVFRTMVERCNLSCTARVSLMRQNSNLHHIGKADLAGDHAFPDSRTFVALLNCYSNHSNFMGFEEAVELIETIFDTMKYWDGQLQWSSSEEVLPHGLMEKDASTSLILNEFSYISLVKAYSTVPSISLEESLKCCNRIEELISEEMNNGSSNAITRGMAVNAWAKCLEYAKDNDEKQRLCVERAANHLDILLESGEDDNAKSIIIDSLCQVMRMFGNASMPDAANGLFQRAKHCSVVNLTTISTIIDVLAESKDISNVEKAHRHLLDLERETMGKKINPSKKHDYTRMYNACISGFINAEQDGSRRAHALIWHMIENHTRNSLHIARPNTTSFAFVMSSLAQQGRSQEVEALLSKMEEMHQCRHPHERDLETNVVPNIVHYNTLMTSYARSDGIGVIQSANKLLHRMENCPNLPSPDAITRSLILKIHSRISGKGSEAETTASDDNVNAQIDLNMEDLNLNDIIANTIDQNQQHLSAKSFNSIMKALANSGTIKGAEQSAALLNKIEEMYAAGDIKIRPDIILYNLVLNAWQLCDPNDEDVSTCPAEKAERTLDSIINRYEAENNDVAPNDATFSICIHAWCKSNRPDAAARAEKILRLKEQYLDRVEGVVIRATDYNSIISKWRADPDKGPARASELFEAMAQKCNESEAYQCPTTVTFNSLLAVYAKSNDQKAAEKAEEYLRRMNGLNAAAKTNIQPDMISYRTCIDAWIRRKTSLSPPKVEALVKDLIDKYQNQGREDLRPDSNVLDLILKACNLAPITWNMNKGEKETIEIANRTFTLLRGRNEFNAQPTHSTYAFMFRILSRHMNFADPRYDLLMKSLWTQCCRDGLVSEFTLESLRRSVTDSTFFECIGHEIEGKPDSVTVASLHRDWRRNVAAKRKSAPLKQEILIK